MFLIQYMEECLNYIWEMTAKKKKSVFIQVNC